jgi:hypothetical protein
MPATSSTVNPPASRSTLTITHRRLARTRPPLPERYAGSLIRPETNGNTNYSRESGVPAEDDGSPPVGVAQTMNFSMILPPTSTPGAIHHNGTANVVDPVALFVKTIIPCPPTSLTSSLSVRPDHRRRSEFYR